jgi:hypothetical protein
MWYHVCSIEEFPAELLSRSHRVALHALALLIHHRMSAFAVAIRGKADMPFCNANVCF